MSVAIVAPILVHIFNCSIKSNSFPTLFKTVKVMPIYKKGDNSVMSNYRPISILSVISLIFEWHVHQFKAFLENNMVLYDRQSGLRENHSCQTALSRLVDDWISAVEMKLSVPCY